MWYLYWILQRRKADIPCWNPEAGKSHAKSSSYQRCLLPSTSWSTSSSWPHSPRVWSSINQTESMSMVSLHWLSSAGCIQFKALTSGCHWNGALIRQHTPTGLYIFPSSIWSVSLGSIKTKYKVDFQNLLCRSVVDQTSNLRLICWDRHNLQETFHK